MRSDLEIIKDCIEQIRWSDADGEYDKVIEAAERMAKRIEELEKEKANAINSPFIFAVGQSAIEAALKEEIAKLKSALSAAKPITCGECKNEYACPRRITFVNDGFEFTKLRFCSRAERKEAE